MSEDTQDITSLAQFGKVFQEKLVQAILSDDKFAEQLVDVFDSNYLDVKYLSYLTEKVFTYYKKYKVFPTMSLLVTIIRDDLKQGNDVLLRNQVVDYLQRMRTNPDCGDLPFVKEKVLEFCKKQALKQALMTTVEHMSSNRYDQIVEVVRKAVSVGTPVSLGHNFIEDTESRFVQLKRSCVPTGLDELDKSGVLNGGLGKGELGIVLAPTAVGKCIQRNTYVHVRYEIIVINGHEYRPWERVNTRRGRIYAKDIVETDELV